MIKISRKPSRKLAKLVLATLMFSGAAQFAISPSIVEADELTVTSCSWNPTTSTFIFGPNPIAMTSIGGSGQYATYVPTFSNVTVLNLGPVEGVWDYTSVAGRKDPTADVSGYTVNVNGARLYEVYGAYSEAGTASKNYVKVIDGPVTQVAGAYSGSGDAIKNSVVIEGGTITGYFAIAVAGGWSNSGNANENTVEIKGGDIIGSLGEGVAGGYAKSGTGNANENTMTISGGTVSQDVYGGYSAGGNANGNTVTITGGTVGTESGWVGIRGGSSSSGAANNNTVTISGGTINADIYGGSGATADGNTVTISGSNTVFLSTKGIHGATAMTGDATNNTVNILTPINVAYLYGGINEADGTTKSTGNTLNVAAKNVSTKLIDKFQNMNFYLPSDIAKDDTMLTVNGSGATDVQGVTFGVAALSGVKLVKGDTVNLITNPNGLTTDDALKTTDSATLAKETFLSANSLTTDNKYELSISKKGEDTIIATVDNVTEQKADEGGSGQKAVSIPDVLKSPVETRAGVVTMINAGADLLIGQGMSNAADAAAAERTEGDAAAAPRAGGFAPFAAVSFGKLRAESGSHVDNKGIGMNLGFAREIENKSGKLLIGPVIEYGHGSYDSYQDSGIKADGKSSYWGIGVIAKQTNDNGFYYEGSLRAGRTKSDYNSDLRPGLHVNYDSSATYWAAHLGVGKLEDIGHDNTLDYYGKYFYSHTGSDSTYLNGANETANFDAVNSHRIRLGARLTHALNEKNKIYGGLAWQYEFKGDARATYSVSGEAPSPSVKGSSGMIELGWQVKPGKSPMTIDLGVTGWVGKQRGITANVQANWTF